MTSCALGISAYKCFDRCHSLYYTYIQVCAHMHTCLVHTHTHIICSGVCTKSRTYTPLYLFVSPFYININRPIHRYTYMPDTHTYINMFRCVYKITYVHTSIYVRTHLYLRTYTPLSRTYHLYISAKSRPIHARISPQSTIYLLILIHRYYSHLQQQRGHRSQPELGQCRSLYTWQQGDGTLR